jgi:succinyl-CoA synthetase beta subunit
MKLLEYKAHELFAAHGIPASQGIVVRSVDELAARAGQVVFPVVVKAQVETGGRGKAGGVRIARDRDELLSAGRGILGLRIGGQPVAALFLTAKRDIAAELYLSIVLDRKRKLPVLVFSAEGGVDINETAAAHPDKVLQAPLDPLAAIPGQAMSAMAAMAKLDPDQAAQLGGIAEGLARLFRGYDCLLAEINPLVLDGAGRLAALDGKIEIDDSSLFRHPDISVLRDEMCGEPLVLTARKSRFLYIPIDEAGAIGVISNGSGMIMSSIDLLSKAGRKTACALDLGGGATADRIAEAVRIVLSNPAVRLVLINIFGGITRCDEVAAGVVRAAADIGGRSIVMRMEGTNKDRGVAICAEAPQAIELVDGLGAAIEAICRRLPPGAGAGAGRGEGST